VKKPGLEPDSRFFQKNLKSLNQNRKVLFNFFFKNSWNQDPEVPLKSENRSTLLHTLLITHFSQINKIDIDLKLGQASKKYFQKKKLSRTGANPRKAGSPLTYTIS
jgi:hypothetical protein